MNFDSLSYPYFSRRTVSYACRGMVVTSQTLAAQAGLDILKKGGNAIDAAIAAAACLTVVEPTSNGIGGDAFALVWTKKNLYGLNSSGPAPAALSLDAIEAAGHKDIPKYGWTPVTVPGVPAAWAALAKRFGRLSLPEILQPAISYAMEGFPISPTVADLWQKAFYNYRQNLSGEQFKPWFDTFTCGGTSPAVGQIMSFPDHARTLKLIAKTEAAAFYRGEIAERIDDFSRQHGGYLRGKDLAAFQPEWVQPISVNYRGYDVWEIPPNGHGLVALMTLNILKGFDSDGNETVENYHRQIEALKLAFADGRRYIAEQAAMDVSVKALLSDAYGTKRRALITDYALQPEAGKPDAGGTVYLATADAEGNMVSYIQSNYMGFGSGLVVPGTGISLHNRGHSFSVDRSSVNRLEPGKRPYHTIIPGFVTKSDAPVGPFGVMGAFMQPQGHVQVIVNAIDRHLNPQTTLDAPRWQWTSGKTIELEPHFPNHIAQALARMGHDIKLSMNQASFGRGQIIWRGKNGVLAGGCEPRCDSSIAVW